MLVIDLMLYYVDCGTKFINDYGDIDGPFYNSLRSVFVGVVENINRAQGEEMYRQLKAWLLKLVSNVQDIGWGYGEYISEMFYQIAWREGE